MPETRSLQENVSQATSNVLHLSGRGAVEGNGNGNPEKQTSFLIRLKIAPEAIRALPADFVKRQRVLPLKIEDGKIYVATADPRNLRVIEDIRLLSGLEVEETEAPAEDILQKIAECYQITVEQIVEE